MKSENADFADWARKPIGITNSKSSHDLQIYKKNFEKQHPVQTENPAVVFTEYFKKASDEYYEDIGINAVVDHGNYEIVEAGSSYSNPIRDFKIHSGIASNLTLKNLYIEKLAIRLKLEHMHLSLVNCRIGELKVEDIGKSYRSNFIISDTYIGKLIIDENTIYDFELIGGYVCNIVCPSSNRDNPFSGSVNISNTVKFPTKPLEGFIQGAQPYKNMQYHLRSLDNYLAADVFHSVELKMERSTDSFANNIASWAYWAFSNYGSSILRPLVWFVCLFIFAVTLICTFDGAKALTDTTYIDKGWQENLMTTDPDFKITKSLVLAGQYSVNPLGVFKTRNLVVPKNRTVLFWVMVYSVFSSISITLFFLAVRRRFKLK